MRPTCELCDRDELSILGAGTRQIAVGERCYGRLLDKNASWGRDVTKPRLLEMMAGRIAPLVAGAEVR